MLVNMKSKTKAVKRKTPHDFEMDYETQCAAKKVNSRMPKSCCISLEPDVNSCRSEAPLKTINSMHPPFGRKRKTPNDFAIDSGILSVTKKGNFGVRENSCTSSQPNSNGDHSDVSLNIYTMHETYGSTHIDVMRKGDPSMWNETQQLGSVMSRKKSSNDPSTVIGTINLNDEGSLEVSSTTYSESVDGSWDESILSRRMMISTNDYPGSGANNRHTPRP
ncbi:hypothetical protein Tco_1015471 [Tanacetum coccineum]|uniref:Uncharacterized protein n=1 Tax=Tanacetum coccineum TaxID=301880 RepID=A0ABQ5FL07_9ASTR